MVAISKEQIAAARKAAKETGPRAVRARYRRASAKLEVEYENGVTLAVPVTLIQELAGASAAALSQIEISPAGTGLHFPRLDADVYVPALFEGIYGTRAWMREHARGMGSATSPAKTAAARENGKKGGRPRKPQAAIVGKAVSVGRQPRRPSMPAGSVAAKRLARVLTAARTR